MIPSPIARALSVLTTRHVQFLLMGGQACIVYGAAEFSRDVDLCIRVQAENLERLRAALDDLEAKPVYVPELSAEVLDRGHACHFRCGDARARDLRIDLMGRLRGVEPWDRVWSRRTTVSLPGVGDVAVMALEDLVLAKKTQRDKDWPMIRRLVEADIFRAGKAVAGIRLEFWLLECRTPELLISLAGTHRAVAVRLVPSRPSLEFALSGAVEPLARALRDEEDRERERDRQYWGPLKEELARLRRLGARVRRTRRS